MTIFDSTQLRRERLKTLKIVTYRSLPLLATGVGSDLLLPSAVELSCATLVLEAAELADLSPPPSPKTSPTPPRIPVAAPTALDRIELATLAPAWVKVSTGLLAEGVDEVAEVTVELSDLAGQPREFNAGPSPGTEPKIPPRRPVDVVPEMEQSVSFNPPRSPEFWLPLPGASGRRHLRILTTPSKPLLSS